MSVHLIVVVVLFQDYDYLLSGAQLTVHSKLVDFQKELVSLQVSVPSYSACNGS